MKKEFITRISLSEAKKLKDFSDWERVEAMSDDEAIANALDDPDNQPLTYPMSKDVKPFKRVK
ncbi:hypothetical protein [Chroococcus sp. FPU101]|uniref:hypothetical protein n=1 Tax=Chroococcus sp. FPU101 TaxID=1974212 RepID=UPI001A8D85C0|nr:hypothetical protein [Chroococcus sp. FPU101]GFE71980.1 hypothetical protein CFPU101_45900 [Chroococcus sp. FPU101]